MVYGVHRLYRINCTITVEYTICRYITVKVDRCSDFYKTTTTIRNNNVISSRAFSEFIAQLLIASGQWLLSTYLVVANTDMTAKCQCGCL